MKKNLLIAAAVAISAPFAAQAGANLELRTDYVNLLDHKDVNNKDQGGYSRFEIPWARAGFEGTVADTTLRARLNLTKNSNGAAALDKTNEFLESAYAERKLTDELSVTLGKLEIRTGGVEGSYNRADVLTWSLAGELVPSYVTGLGFDYTMAGHSIGAQLLNGQGAQTDQRQHGWGLYYAGSFADKMVMPKLSYYTIPTSGKLDNNYMAVGFQVNVQALSVDFDYLSNVHPDKTTLNKDDKDTSFVAAIRYKIDSWVPELKVDIAENELADAKQYKRQTYTLALRYMPKENLSYHVAWENQHYDYDIRVAKDKPTTNKIIIGMIITADLLK